jgi:hypothetical protein
MTPFFRFQYWPIVFVASSSQSRSASSAISSTARKNFTAFRFGLPRGRSFPAVTRRATSSVVQLNGVQQFRKLGFGYKLPPYQRIVEIIRRGEGSYPEFLSFWKDNIAPAEEMIRNWFSRARLY